MYIVQCDDLLAAQVRGPNPGTWRSRRSTTAEQLPRNQWGGRVFGNFCDSQFILTTDSKNRFNFWYFPGGFCSNGVVVTLFRSWQGRGGFRGINLPPRAAPGKFFWPLLWCLCTNSPCQCEPFCFTTHTATVEPLLEIYKKILVHFSCVLFPVIWAKDMMPHADGPCPVPPKSPKKQSWKRQFLAPKWTTSGTTTCKVGGIWTGQSGFAPIRMEVYTRPT